ncbi:hypothetical protein KIPB_009618 [Kipferlia bialata]|uniref:Uncharacterized protein n=1 Tax=Kipferlia bialata TaxID=797122 RepID=A0A391NNZ7_9EUKA|nr:hypothetical protein KIPB_009618 [Kipferlia bialata]|eukprot:g9618.t1
MASYNEPSIISSDSEDSRSEDGAYEAAAHGQEALRGGFEPSQEGSAAPAALVNPETMQQLVQLLTDQVNQSVANLGAQLAQQLGGRRAGNTPALPDIFPEYLECSNQAVKIQLSDLNRLLAAVTDQLHRSAPHAIEAVSRIFDAHYVALVAGAKSNHNRVWPLTQSLIDSDNIRSWPAMVDRELSKYGKPQGKGYGGRKRGGQNNGGKGQGQGQGQGQQSPRGGKGKGGKGQN